MMVDVERPLTSADIPRLPGYVTIPEAAEILGITRTTMYYKIYEQRAFRTLFRVGDPEEGRRPIVLLLETEVRDLARREAELAVHTPDPLNAWNKRVKDWARGNGMTVHVAGQPSMQLRTAYVAAYPQDPRPQE